VTDPELVAALEALQGKRVRVTAEGVKRIGTLRMARASPPRWFLDPGFRPIMLSAVACVEQRHAARDTDVYGRPVTRSRTIYSVAWSADWT
jgi:hypothetical protein